MKLCSHCNEEKEFTEFHKNKSRKDGYQHVCKSCKKDYYKEDYQKNRQTYLDKNEKRRNDWRKLIAEQKSVGCSRCSENDLWCMDFHHREETGKDFTVADCLILMYNEKNVKMVLDEIAKCDVVCANCHRKLHKKQFFSQ